MPTTTFDDALAAIQVTADHAFSSGDFAPLVDHLRRAAQADVGLLVDSGGIAERAATAARAAGDRATALDLLRLAHDAASIWASWSTSGGEGMQRMLDVDRLARQIRAWEQR